MHKAKHAFGQSSGIEAAKQAGKINEFDILFLDGNTEPKIGWLDSQGNTVVIDHRADLSKLETQVEAELAKKASAEDVETLEGQIAAKANTSDVEAKIKTAVTDTVASANAYTDKMVEAAMGEHLTKKYEIADVPEGTLVDYRESEIRVMCPANAIFTKQNVGAGGDANNYYMTFKTYFPENAVGYIEHLNGEADEEILTKFSTDEYGRKYQPTWLGIAKYNESTDEWTYYGASSSVNKYIGWDYQIDWYDADGVMIASDSVRINLSNEDCHSEIKPYYVGSMMGDIDEKINTKVEEKIKEVESSYEIIEF